MLRKPNRKRWNRPTPASADPADTVYYRSSDAAILGTQRHLQEVADKMARVEGAKGTINEGVIGDVGVFENLTDGADNDELWQPAGADPAGSVDRLAQGVVRGETFTNPADAEVAKKARLADRAHDVVLTGNAKAKKGSHVLFNESEPNDNIVAVTLGLAAADEAVVEVAPEPVAEAEPVAEEPVKESKGH